jgi:hypothetical protein
MRHYTLYGVFMVYVILYTFKLIRIYGNIGYYNASKIKFFIENLFLKHIHANLFIHLLILGFDSKLNL